MQEVLHVGNSRVCALGAGSSGIPACQVLPARGTEFDCFETGSQVGGTSPLARVRWWPLQRAGLALTMRLVRGDVTKYGLPEPDHKLGSAHPTISDDLLVRLGRGDIGVKPNIERLDGDSVRFVDGSRERIDT